VLAPRVTNQKASTGNHVAPPKAGQPWTVLHMVKWAGEYLTNKGVENGRLNGEHLLAHTLDLGRMDLYLQFDRPLIAEELSRFKPMLKRRAEREPLQYILGTAPFRNLTLRVDRRVLVPRPETEYMLEVLQEVVTEAGHPRGPWMGALDLGTGSGALAIAMAEEGLAKGVVAVDCSAEALSLAMENAETLGFLGQVDFRLGDLFEPVHDDRFELVLSNPPYLPDGEWAETQPEVRDWEPSIALKGGADGMDVLRRLISRVASHVEVGGWLGLEMASDQTRCVAGLLGNEGNFGSVSVRNDLTGRSRYVFAQRS